MQQYHRYRNAVQRLAAKLKKGYYNRQIAGLRQGNARNWWKHIKSLTGQTKSDQIDNLASEMFEGDFQLLADCINESHTISHNLAQGVSRS